MLRVIPTWCLSFLITWVLILYFVFDISGVKIFITGTNKMSNSIKVVWVCIDIFHDETYDYWFSNYSLLISTEYHHRFLGDGEGANVLSEETLQALKMRAVYYNPQWPKKLKVRVWLTECLVTLRLCHIDSETHNFNNRLAVHLWNVVAYVLAETWWHVPFTDLLFLEMKLEGQWTPRPSYP